MTVKLEIGSRSFALECTLDAFRSIPSALGGFVGAFNKLASADVETCVYIIAAATGKARDFDEQNNIAALIFANGLDKNLFDTLTRYVTLLQNGGKASVDQPNGASSGE
jgi:hypothetical protein